MPRPRRATAGLVVLATAVAILAGCTDDTSGEEPQSSGSSSAADADLGSKPDLLPFLPDDRGDPPTELMRDDIVDGDGEQAGEGDVLTVHFVGASWSSGAEFDATWDRGQPFTFELGSGRVIEGWELGLVGMREGGRRLLIVPAELAYGERGASGDIGPGETLVFVIDLVEVRTGP